MTGPTLSYAQSLRVIGQALEELRIGSFKLEKTGERYIIRNWEPSFLQSVAEKVWRRGDSKQMLLIPGGRAASPLAYTSSDTSRLEAQGRSRRGSNDSPDAHDVSLALRVVGDYLDRHGAIAFDISWTMQSVTVKYETVTHHHKEANCTVQNLHDLGVGMYLRRSSRRPAE
jgi:hypothetical protein